MKAHQLATTTPGPAGIDPTALTHEQLQGWRCALCCALLTGDRPLGTVTIGEGPTLTTYPLWACNPNCATESAWRAAITHAAGCQACRTGECETGQRLLDTYSTAIRQEHARGAG
ncbi:hypothetical protein [Streptomyces sp. S465]|uniref:hypothetical protein n=1 Tax=Streptomyces sp. S465 TaxID=2979468 RepID=UPI0022A8CB61|nr:hypothetical protein [Streptomyces sp. S465]WAP55773.1 hypothetical protein N6H00_12710 [Streptomyces sp. S465]